MINKLIARLTAMTRRTPRPGYAADDRAWAESITSDFQAKIGDYDGDVIDGRTRKDLTDSIQEGLAEFTDACRRACDEAQDAFAKMLEERDDARRDLRKARGEP